MALAAGYFAYELSPRTGHDFHLPLALLAPAISSLFIPLIW
jgi:hypothetical protein